MQAIVTSLVGALASNVVGGLFNKKDKTPPPAAPTVEPPTLMPDPLAEKAAQRRKAATTLSRQLNSADTILAGGDSMLGA